MPSRNFSGPRCTRLIASFLIRLPKSCIRLVSNQKLGYLLLRQYLSLALTVNALNNLKFSAIWTFFDRQLFKKYICKFCPVALVSWNPTIFNIICWVTGSMKWLSHWPSIIFFHNFLQNSLQKPFQFIFLFKK